MARRTTPEQRMRAIRQYRKYSSMRKQSQKEHRQEEEGQTAAVPVLNKKHKNKSQQNFKNKTSSADFLK